EEGFRESKQSWKALLLSLRDRGLKTAPKLGVGDGAMGFWAVLAEVFPTTRTQRCWVHKTVNILDKLPKTQQPEAKSALHQIWQANSRQNAEKAFDRFVAPYEQKYPKAVDCLKDREELLVFYDFPRGALATHPNDEPDRIDVRDDPVANEEDEELRMREKWTQLDPSARD